MRDTDAELIDGFRSIVEHCSNEFACELDEVFLDGVRLGAKLMLEILGDDYSHGEDMKSV